MGDPVVWAFIFAAGMVILFVMEVFVPSGGILGTLAAVCLAGLIVTLFMIDQLYGVIGLVASVFVVPAAIAGALKVFPHTPIGRGLILSDEQKAGATRYSSTGVDDTSDLLGKEGVTATPLYPGGMVKIDGKPVQCLAEHGAIESGVRVKVVHVAGIEVKVKPV